MPKVIKAEPKTTKTVKSVKTEKAVVKAEVSKVAEAKTTTPKKSGSLSVPLFTLKGTESGTLDLPKEIFGVEKNDRLLAQAIRVYTTNGKNFTASTKTRGEVEGSTAKIFKQKGTGRARHGGIRAPIFVGGGIVFGPTPRKVRLDLPQKMKRAALITAMSMKVLENKVMGVDLDKASGKTKEIVGLITKIGGSKKRHSALIVIETQEDNVVRASRNISQTVVMPANLVNAYEVLSHDLLLVTKGAVEKLAKGPKESAKEETK